MLWVFLFRLGVLFFDSAMLGPGRSRLLGYLSLVLGAAGVFGFVGGSVAPPLLGLSFAVYFISIFWNLAVGSTLYRSPASDA